MIDRIGVAILCAILSIGLPFFVAFLIINLQELAQRFRNWRRVEKLDRMWDEKSVAPEPDYELDRLIARIEEGRDFLIRLGKEPQMLTLDPEDYKTLLEESGRMSIEYGQPLKYMGYPVVVGDQTRWLCEDDMEELWDSYMESQKAWGNQ